MNRAMGFSSKLRRLTAPVKCLSDDPRGTRHRARNIAPHTSHEGSWCQASIALPNRKLLPSPHWSPGPALSSLS
jgi:hypothetical protein